VRLLLDTHAFLWWVADDDALTPTARAAISDPANECLFSAASAWEISIKVSIGKLSLVGDVRRFLPEQMAANGFEPLPVSVTHAARVADLPFHHRDPFDRLLAAQALEERIAIISADAVFRKYGVKRIW
jgi:PIN domain nuclease of toxin-antitoxin system